jgi:hypothetical protein
VNFAPIPTLAFAIEKNEKHERLAGQELRSLDRKRAERLQTISAQLKVSRNRSRQDVIELCEEIISHII